MHLDAVSWYSFHHGVASPQELCAEAAQLGFSALGICDRDGTYGLIGFYKAAVKCGLRPLLGISLSAAPGLHARAQAQPARPLPPHSPRPDANVPAENAGSLRLRDKTVQNADAQRGIVSGLDPPLAVVLARNRDGYSELCALASGRQLDLHWNAAQALLRGTESCIVITDNESLLRFLGPRLGPKRLFVRTAPDYGPAYRAQQLRQLKLAAHYKLRPAACTEVCFSRPQDQSLHHVLRAIGQNTSLPQASGVRPRSHYLSAPPELAGYYYECPQALASAREIAERCEVDFILGKWQFPQYELPGKQTPLMALGELCQQGLARRLGSGVNDSHRARLEMELSAIEELGYCSYFLFVYEIVREAFRRGIPFLGRGSAANSIVSYLLGLTPIDPLKYNMFFERFLNRERTSPPDIDIDFDWKRRDEILQFVYERWGEDRVAMISTHQTFQARGALREVGKVFGLSNAEISQISRYMPQMNAGKLTSLVHKLPEMRGIDLKAQPYCELLPLAARLAGRPRHLGIHCGGIVISPGKLTEYTGLQRAAKGFVVTQYDMFPIEDIGLIKIDLLGNRSLGVLHDTLGNLSRQGIQPPINDLATLTKDKRIRRMLSTGNTIGCFYIESPAMRALLARLRTQTYLGLTAASSVIRPGVAESGMMQEFIRRVNGMERRLPSHPLMEKLLPETHGVMVYQEDVIRVAHELAGMSATQSDILRRGMSGKHRSAEDLNRLREVFLAGCEANGVDSGSALEIWRQLSSFSGYSFCKAHSASFATLSYQVAWLKAYYPAEFMAAVISNGGGFYGMRTYLSECERLGLAIRLPDVNCSQAVYTAEASQPGQPCDSIRVGLGAIKGLRSELILRIPAERERRGPYDSLPGFVRRVRPNEAELEALILCGALDSLGLPRPQLLRLARASQAGEKTAAAAQSARIFAASEDQQSYSGLLDRACSGFSAAQLDELEQLYFGILISRHPLRDFEPLLRGEGFIKAVDIARYSGRRVRMVGRLIAAKRVNMTGRKAGRDTLPLLAGDYDEPEQDSFGGPEEEERVGTGQDLGLVGPNGPASSGRQYNNYYASAPRAMEFMSMEDLSGTFEVTLFPDVYNLFAPLTREPGPFVVEGVVDEQFGVCSLTASRLQLLSDFLRARGKTPVAV